MKLYLSLGLAALVSAAPVWAQPPKLDANGDGFVSLQEFEAPRLEALRQRFAALDTDGDGQLSQAELSSGRRGMGRHGEGASRIDTDGDGAWSLAEIQAVRPDFTVEQFNRLDRNGDGLITADERPFHRGPGAHGPVPASQGGAPAPNGL